MEMVEASILINIHAVHVVLVFHAVHAVHAVHAIHAIHVVNEVLAHDVKSLTLFHITVHGQVLNANVKLTFCENIS
jgi:hypothetical protein